jgi:hypothetical protein
VVIQSIRRPIMLKSLFPDQILTASGGGLPITSLHVDNGSWAGRGSCATSPCLEEVEGSSFWSMVEGLIADLTPRW